MALRFRAHLRMTEASWATWLHDNFATLMTHAFHLREGDPGEELSVTEVTDDGFTHRCDIFWPDDRDDLLQQGVDWVTDPGVQARVAEDTFMERSWADHHRCRHDQENIDLCPKPDWRWSL